jgi:uncharacterized protein
MRLIRGSEGWWFISRAGTALIPDMLVRDGRLSAEGSRQVSAAGLDRMPAPRHYSLTVLTATACNLTCPYCFQNAAQAQPGAVAARGIARAVLDETTIGATVSFAVERMAKLGATRLRLLLFGGEPLLNRAGCLAVLRRCAERVPTAGSMISNGTLLSGRLAAELESAGLRTVQITLDGPRALHDAVRATRAGRGTFDAILANVAAAQDRTELDFTLRINLTARVLPAIGEALRHAAAIVDPARTRVALAPVLDGGVAGSPRPPSAAAEQSASEQTVAADQAVRAYALAQQLGFRTVLPRDGHCDFCSVSRGRYGAVVNADGALFSCWESAGRPGYAVGTVTGGYDDYPPERWISCGAHRREPELRTFTDVVDAGLLDLARARGRVSNAERG